MKKKWIIVAAIVLIVAVIGGISYYPTDVTIHDIKTNGTFNREYWDTRYDLRYYMKTAVLLRLMRGNLSEQQILAWLGKNNMQVLVPKDDKFEAGTPGEVEGPHTIVYYIKLPRGQRNPDYHVLFIYVDAEGMMTDYSVAENMS